MPILYTNDIGISIISPAQIPIDNKNFPRSNKVNPKMITNSGASQLRELDIRE